MANLLSDLVYVDLDDVKDTSEIIVDGTPSDAVLTKLVTNAQYIIDEYIIAYWEPFSETQDFIFPIENEDSESEIPTDIKLATIRIVEYLYLKGTENEASLKGKEVNQEKNLGRSVVYSENTGWYNKSVETIQIPKKALNVLDKYRQTFIWQKI